MIVLGIDTSCDDTAIGVVRDGHVIANAIASQASHAAFGGVMPEIASREHLERIDAVLDQALQEARIAFDEVDLIAATRGPGLAGSLLVGFTYAKGLAFASGKSFYAMHHLEGHIQAALASQPTLAPPYLALVVSGGHTHLFDCTPNQYTPIGATRDDAAGEAFDKVARLLGLGFPGGPAIAKTALAGNPHGFALPLPLKNQQGFDFSYSGLKNAMRLAVESNAAPIADLAASFQQVVVESLVRTSARAAKHLGHDTIIVSGGVAANQALRTAFLELAEQENWKVLFPPAGLNTDNGAMIALAGFVRAKKLEQSDDFALGIEPHWPLASTHSALSGNGKT